MRQPSIFIPHGGGPCFFMDPPPDEPSRWLAMEAYLRELPLCLPQRPQALLVVSAHWEMPRPTVLAAAQPGLLFDYYGFPPHTYQLTYPAPGAPELAARVRQLLAAAGIASDEDLQRDFDHGIFVPLKVSFPQADIPILQLSLREDLDPASHLAIGRALSVLRDENVLIIGSGLSFHNLRALGGPAGPAREFDRWLTETVCEVAPAQRDTRLAQWGVAPGARACHPREQHLLPLMVAVGAAAGDPGQHAFSGTIWGQSVSAYHFG
ncbi:MAG: dioxygenase [Gammaproteobacteria bacterium]|nr:dioxygenase [Gammaproteobacteria bacterium]